MSSGSPAKNGPPKTDTKSNSNVNTPVKGTSTAEDNFISAVNLIRETPELQAMLAEVIPTIGMSDPTDDINFNPFDYINKLFPTEQSLSNIDTTIKKVGLKADRLEEEMKRSVREQAFESKKGSQNLVLGRKAIDELATKIHEIKGKAEHSERMVIDICSEIKMLDNANHNLTNTISTLRRFQMYMTAVEQLESFASQKKYQDAGRLLAAVLQLDNLFTQYTSAHTKIQHMHDNVINLKKQFHDQAYEEFGDYLDAAASRQQEEKMINTASGVCMIIDSLDESSKDDFKKWICAKELTDYNKWYLPGEEAAGLEHFERRITWFQKILKKFDELYKSVIPSSWNMSELFAEEFCKTTRRHLEDLLESTKGAINADDLLVALKKSIQLERDLSTRFATSLTIRSVSSDNLSDDEDIQPVAQSSEDDMNINAEIALNPHSAAAIRERWKQHQEKSKKEEERRKRKEELASDSPLMPRRVIRQDKFKGMISKVFDPHLGEYAKKEDQNIRALLQKFAREETWLVDEEEKVKVLVSSTDLFYYYKTSMKIIMGLTKGPALFDLFTVFKRNLVEFSNFLASRIPSEGSKLSEKDQKRLCLIINTAEYCSNTTEGLASSIKKAVMDDYKDKIDLSLEQAEFEGVIAKAMKSMVSGLLSNLESAFNAMIKLPLGTWNVVEDQSPYVFMISESISQCTKVYAKWLNNVNHFSYFCDSFCLAFVPVFIQNVYKCKRINVEGAQQLMLDLAALKSIITDIPKVGMDVSSRYLKTVKKEITKGENLLKVILCQPGAVVETFKSLLKEGSENDFIAILDLKGIPRHEQKPYIDSFKGQHSATTLLPQAKPTKSRTLKDVFTMSKEVLSNQLDYNKS